MNREESFLSAGDGRFGHGTEDESFADRDPGELKLARALGEYVDRLTEGERTDSRVFAAEHPELRGEIDAIEGVESILEPLTRNVLFGDYKVLREIARGGMGVVYEAHQVSLDRRVALKMLPAGLLADTKAVARFQREARIAGRLHHPNVVEVYEMGIQDGVPYFAMEYVEGETLQQIQQRLRQGGAGRFHDRIAEIPSETLATLEWLYSSRGRKDADLSDYGLVSISSISEACRASAASTVPLERGAERPEELAFPEEGSSPPEEKSGSQNFKLAFCRQFAEIMAGVADGLHYAHNARVVHRDMKPSNLILDTRGRLRILDFGLAWVEGQESLTWSRECVGTPMYMSPEQARGDSAPLDRSTDIYSLGATMYDLLAGRPPFQGKSSQEILHQIIHRDPLPPHSFTGGVPRDLETIVMKCLRKEPLQRYLTAEALAQDLRRFARGDPIEACPQPILERLVRRAWKSKGRILQAAALVVALVAVGLHVKGRIDAARARELESYQSTVAGAALRMLELGRSLPGLGVQRSTAGWTMETQEGKPFTDPSDLMDRDVDPVVVSVYAEVGRRVADTKSDPVLEAIAVLQSAAESQPHRAEAYCQLARARLILGQREEALEELRRALDCSSRCPHLSVTARLMEKMGMRAPEIEAAKGAPAPEAAAEAWAEADHASMMSLWSEAEAAFGKLEALCSWGTASQDQNWSLEDQLCSLERCMGRGVVRFQLGSLAEALGDFVESRYHWRALRRSAPEPCLFRGQVQYLLGDKSAAERSFNELASAATTEELKQEATIKIAAAYRDFGDFETALEWVEKVPESPGSVKLQAEMAYLSNRLEEAMDLGRKALKASPDDAGAHVILGNILSAGGETEKAFGLFRKATELSPQDPRARVAWGLAREADGDLAGARAEFERAVDCSGRSADGHYNLGRILKKEGRLGEAEREYRTALALNPRHALACNSLGILLGQQNKTTEAMELFSRATASDPASDPRLPEAHFNLGWALYSVNRFEEAIEEYGKAIRGGFDNFVVRNHLGAALVARARYHEAQDELNTAIWMEPRSGLTHFNLGVVQWKLNDTGRAEESFRRAHELEREDPDALNQLGLSLKGKRDLLGAAKCFREAARLDPDHASACNYLASLILDNPQEVPTLDELANDIRLLEAGTQASGADPQIVEALGLLRKRHKPCLASYASLDWILDHPEGDVLLDENAEWLCFRGTSEPSKGLEWTQEGYRAEGWVSVRGGVGYGDKGKVGQLGLDLSDMLSLRYGSAYLRREVDIASPLEYERFILAVLVDDGFVAYVNGREVGRRRAPGVPHHKVPSNAMATASVDSPRPETVEIDVGLFHPGRNVLAVHGLNCSRTSSDFVLVPALRSVPHFDIDRARKDFEEFDPTAPGEQAQALTSYFKGRILQRSGKPKEAIVEFEKALVEDPAAAEIILSISECLVASGDPPGAEQYLRRSVLEAAAPEKSLWDAWFRTSLVDLGLGISEALASIPAAADPRASSHPGAGRRAELCWVLEQLQGEGAIRINCGGGEYKGTDGNAWGRDRFYLGGRTYMGYMDAPRDIQRTQDAPLYQTERVWSPEDRGSLGYIVPLPPGKYRVVLHFAELWFSNAGDRLFDVTVEGKTEQSLDICKSAGGKGVVLQVLFEVQVEDGDLAISFQPHAENPKISAIEIERL